MSHFTAVPTSLWRDVRDFFAPLVSPCKDCVRGNSVRCWQGDCPAFRFRDIARRIEGVSLHAAVRIPRHVRVENEILDALLRHGEAVYPSQLVLTSTNSSVTKSHAISRLVRQGRIVEERINDYTRKISLPKRNPKDEQRNKPEEPRTGEAL